jgi:hypothetical protein
MTVSTACPPVTWLRNTLECHILDIRNSDLTLKPEISWPGRYELPDNSHIPAVYVIGELMVPSEWNINGIEMTIEDVPEIENPGSMSGVVSYERWRVRFTNYGWEESTSMVLNMRDIARRLARAFPSDQVTYMARTEATFESLSVRILGPYINPPIP